MRLFGEKKMGEPESWGRTTGENNADYVRKLGRKWARENGNCKPETSFEGIT